MGATSLDRRRDIQKLFERSPRLDVIDQGQIDIWFNRATEEERKLEDRLLACQTLVARATYYRGQLRGWTNEAKKLQKNHNTAFTTRQEFNLIRQNFGNELLKVWQGNRQDKNPSHILLSKWDDMVKSLGYTETLRRLRNNPFQLGALRGKAGLGYAKLRPFSDSKYRAARRNLCKVLSASRIYENAFFKSPQDEQFQELTASMHNANQAKNEAIDFLDRLEKHQIEKLSPQLMKKSVADWKLRSQRTPISAWQTSHRHAQIHTGLTAFRHPDLWQAEASRLAEYILNDKSLKKLAAAEGLTEELKKDIAKIKSAKKSRKKLFSKSSIFKSKKGKKGDNKDKDDNGGNSGGNIIQFPTSK